jgi:hypothetical protein
MLARHCIILPLSLTPLSLLLVVNNTKVRWRCCLLSNERFNHCNRSPSSFISTALGMLIAERLLMLKRTITLMNLCSCVGCRLAVVTTRYFCSLFPSLSLFLDFADHVLCCPCRRLPCCSQSIHNQCSCLGTAYYRQILCRNSK